MGFEHFPWISRWLEEERGSRLTSLSPPSPTPEERANHRAQRRSAIAFFDPSMPDSATIAASTAGPIRRMQHSSLYNRVARPVVAPLSLIEDYDEAYASANPGELPPRLYERVTRRERQLTYKPGQKITFMTLPPEIRNHIYDFAYAQSASTPLKDLKLPRSLRVPGIFTEAISFFFANTPVSMAFRSNWCVRYQHLHTPTHIRYPSTGIVKLPSLLRRDMRVPEQAVRFRELKFDVQCACCSHAKTVCMMGFRVVAFGSEDASGSKKGWRIEAKPISVIVEVEEFWGHLYDKVVIGVDMMMGVALQQARMIELREGFNGFSVRDIQDLAMCFRDESENPRPLVLQEGELVEEWDDQEAAYLLDV